MFVLTKHICLVRPKNQLTTSLNLSYSPLSLNFIHPALTFAVTDTSHIFHWHLLACTFTFFQEAKMLSQFLSYDITFYIFVTTFIILTGRKAAKALYIEQLSSNYLDLLRDIPKYFCPIEILYILYIYVFF